MSPFSPELLSSWTGGRWSQIPAQAIRGFATDTRQLRKGQVFVALRTEKRDGHDFLAAAAAAGASAAIVSRQVPEAALPQLIVADPLRAFQAIACEHRRGFGGKVIGISGSCGKTSTKELIALLLGGEQGGVMATEGNLNNHLGVPLTLTRIDPRKHRFAVIEAGISGPGEMDALAQMIEPDLTLITLIGPAHLLELGGLDGVAREKSKLAAATRATGVAIFPKQCETFSPFRDLDVRKMIIEPAEVLRPAEPPKDTVYFSITQRGTTTAISLAYGPPPPLLFTMRRVSAGMAQNVVLAICAALWLGVFPEEIQARLGSWRPAHWRGEVLQEEGRMLYVDCYNANPASMADALEIFCDIAPVGEPRLFVLGCMEELGPDAARFHRELGLSLRLQKGDRACLIGGEAESLRAGLIQAGADAAQIEIAAASEALAPLVAGWRGGVFVKGSRKYRLETSLSHTSLAPAGAH